LPEPHSIPGVDPNWWKFVLYPGWEADRDGPLEVVCARQWIASNEQATREGAALGGERWAEVRYEDLIHDPISEVGRLMEFAQLPYETAVRDKAAAVASTPINTVTPPEPGKWRRENPREIRAIEPLIGPTMEMMGYRLDED